MNKERRMFPIRKCVHEYSQYFSKMVEQKQIKTIIKSFLFEGKKMNRRG